MNDPICFLSLHTKKRQNMINDLELKSLKRISDFVLTDFFLLIDDQFYTLTMFNAIFLNNQ